jgi:glucosyl-dolichyl phosphate glucuronosyltransferase
MAEALGGFHRAALPMPLRAAGHEPEPIEAIIGSSGRVVYDPLAAVDYLVPADRLIPEWFRRRAAWRAVSDLLQSPPPTVAALAERWQTVKDFFFDCPPTERTIRGLVLRQDDPRRFQQQISAIYDSLFCLLSGFGEPDYD